MAELGQQTVEFSTLVGRAAEESFLSLKELVEKSKSSELSDTERKINLLKYIVKTQQRMLRLNVLAKWCQQVPLIQYCQQLASTLSSHDTCFTQTADSLFFMHEGLQQARAPIYDVPSAVEVLLTGSYQRLPKCIDDVGMQGTLDEEQQKPALRKLDTLVRSKLLEASFPGEISEVKVENGTALLRVDGEFKVLVTLGYRGHLSLWRILHLDLLVGERSGPVKLEEMRRHVLGDDLERRMAASENPFKILYSVLHELCVALIMDTVIRQVHTLRMGRWKDAIKFELISDGGAGQGGNTSSVQMTQDGEVDSAGHRIPGVKIIYWLDPERNYGASDGGSCPFIKIEPGVDLQIKCVHSSFVIDPATGKEADFYLDPSCIDVEKMLLKAICCNRYTRLLEMHKELKKNSQICRSDGDIFLDCLIDEAESDHRKKDIKYGRKESDGHEVLRIRAYGSSYFILGMNIRNGRYLLQSSRNIIAPSVLSDSEESLNQGSRTAAEVFINLRSKSILHLFASIGKFLGLQVYENGFAAAKMPKTVSNDSNYLLMGFPESGSSYLFLLQVDEDFKPLFKLVETQTDQLGKCDVVRVKRIEIVQMRVLEDDMNMSILDQGKISTLLSASGSSDQHPEHDLLSDFSLEHSKQISACPPSTFSSVVDEVFDLEKGTSAPSVMSSIEGGVTSPKWEENLVKKGPGVGSPYNGSLYLASDIKGLNQSSSISSVPSVHGRSGAVQKLQLSKSAQDLASLRSPCAVDDGSLRAMDDDQLSSLSDSSKTAVVRSSLTRHLSSNPPGGSRFSSQSVQLTTRRNMWNSCVAESSKLPTCDAMAAIPVAQAQDFPSGQKSSVNAILNFSTSSRKRTVCDMLNLLPSLQDVDRYIGASKRRKLAGSGQQPSPHSIISKEQMHKFERYSYGDLVAEANRGKAPSSIYMAAFLHVVRHCSLCIKHAQLTSQMEALDIPYVQELCNANAFSNIWFRLPSANGDSWPHICLRLGRPGSMHWDVKINDQHYRDLWDLQKGNNTSTWGSGVRVANTSDVDSHISYDSEGVVLSYQSVEPNSIKKLVADIRRLSSARMFALGMRKLLGVRMEAKSDEFGGIKGPTDGEKLSEQMMRKAFRIEAVGFMSLWFSFSGVLARFVVEWESGKEGCTMHVSPDGLWPHTKFLEDFINGGEVASLLDCIRLTAGPLHALAAATRPARAGQGGVVPGAAMMAKQNVVFPSQGLLPGSPVTNAGQVTSNSGGNPVASSSSGALGSQGLQSSVMLATAGRGGSGIVPSSLLPIDVSVVLRGPYWIRIIYRKHFAVDMRCFAGDQVWLQPATPPKGGPSVGGSLPCPQFRPFIMEHVAQELNGIEPNFTGGQPSPMNSNNANPSSNSQLAATGSRVNLPNGSGLPRSANQLPGIARCGNSLSVTSNLAAMSSVIPLRRSAGAGVPAHVRGELNTAIIGLGDDGGYGGGWVPLVALKKVLRGILKYLGVLWLFAQLPDLLKEILGSILKENEGALLNLDQEQPALRFFVGGYVFAVSVHRVQLLLQVLSVKRFQHSQQQQQNLAATQEELTQSEISEICDYFSRRVASEPYDASRVASFITLLTLPISVLREFLKLITWKRSMSQAQSGDVAPSQKPRVELCLENHTGLNMNGMTGNLSASKSNIHYDRPHNSVEFALTVVLDPAHIPHINAAGGAAWLPYCVSVRLRYSFGDSPSITFLGMEGSHGGRACWLGVEEWDKCKQRVARTIEVQGFSAGDVNQGRLRLVADSIQQTLPLCLQGVREGGAVGSSGAS